MTKKQHSTKRRKGSQVCISFYPIPKWIKHGNNMALTSPLESATRKKIDLMLNSLGWNTDEDSSDCNVFTERAMTKEQNAKFKGNSPDYVLYQCGTNNPIAIIEAKRKGQSIEDAVKQGVEKYATPLNIPIVFGLDGTFVRALDLRANKELMIDGEALHELISEERLLRFVKEGYSIEEVPKALKYTREELIRTFKWANDLLRKEGLRNLDRFVEFANLLFIKIISEIEDDRAKNGEARQLDKSVCWDSFADMKDATTMLNYINDTVLKNGLAKEYNHTDDIFQEKLKIKNPETVKQIVERLSKLTLLNTESEIKGDAFEYFLKSLASGNDLGEYFTPRHIVKLMVELINPKYGNTIFDPFCGTGGFLIESFRHVKKGVDDKDKGIMKTLKEESIFGIELTDTYKIAKMNMIITGDGHNNIISDDSAKNEYWKDKDLKKVFDKLNLKGFDVILSNIPYGQTTDYGSRYPIPSNQGDSIFLQHIILSLNKNGKCGVIVPEGLLFKKEHRKLREYLLQNCDLEAVIALPMGVFLPYTNVKTYILIFTKGSSTKKVWFYNVENDGFELATNRKKINRNDIPDLLSKWVDKPTSEKSFWIDIGGIAKTDYALNLNAYRVKPQSTVNKYPLKKLSEVCLEIKSGGTPDRTKLDYFKGDINWVSIGDINSQIINETKEKLTQKGIEDSSAKLLPKGTVIISIFATLGEVAILGKEATTNQAIAGLIVNSKIINNKFLYYVLRSKKGYIESLGRGVAQQNINLAILKDIIVPVPPLDVQENLVGELDKQKDIQENAKKTLESLESTGISKSFFDRAKKIKLTDVADINPQYTLTENSYEYFVDMSSVDEITGKIKAFSKREVRSSGLTKFKDNDVLFAKITPCTENGKVAVVQGLNGETGLGSTEFIVLSPKKVVPKWLYFLLKTSEIKTEAVKSMKGTTGRQRVPTEFFENLEIPEYALDEQATLVRNLDYYIETKENLIRIVSLSEQAIQRTIESLGE